MEWDSPWGKGFPGWHIECSVLAMKYLGETIDIHCGGVDHIAVHHTNEIAQSEAATGKKFANFWLHNEFMLADRKKMAKSLGNYYTLHDLIKKGFPPLAFRYLCLSVHYRSQMNFTFDAMRDAQNTLESINNFIDKIRSYPDESERPSKKILPALDSARKGFTQAIEDDLDTPNALAAIFGLMKAVNKEIDAQAADKKSLDEVLHFFTEVNSIFDILEEKKAELTTDEKKLIELSEHFRRNKDFRASDEIRRQLKEKGIILEDTPKGTTWKKVVSG
jgi:cysteinyl-tRNA synthetase